MNSYGLADVDAVLRAHGNRGDRLARFEAALCGSRMHLETHALSLGAVGSTSIDEAGVEFLAPGREQIASLFVFGKRRQKISSYGVRVVHASVRLLYRDECMHETSTGPVPGTT